jgi:ribosome-associated toxin RatA of RatAB toxin-antitoxin module
MTCWPGGWPTPSARGTNLGYVEEQVSEHMVIGASPAHCYKVLTDFEHYPEWAADIKSVTIDERDDQGRPVVVGFRAAAFGRSTSYTLRYDYSEAPERLSWHQVSGDVTRRLDGSYEIRPGDDGSTEVTYHLVVDLKVPLPVFVKRRAEGRITHTALAELRARAEA